MNFRASKADGVFSGQYTLSEDKVRFYFCYSTSVLSLYGVLFLDQCKWRVSCSSSFADYVFIDASLNFLNVFVSFFASGNLILFHLQVEAALLYPGLRPTVLRLRLRYLLSYPVFWLFKRSFGHEGAKIIFQKLRFFNYFLGLFSSFNTPDMDFNLFRPKYICVTLLWVKI